MKRRVVNTKVIESIIIKSLEAVHFAVLFFNNADFAEKVLDILTLVTGELDDLSVFRVLNNCAVAFVFLKKKHRKYNSISETHFPIINSYSF